MAEQKRSPVKYRARETSLIDNKLVQPGEVVEYDGLPSDNLEPLDAEGEARAAEFRKSDRERQERQAADNKESAVGDPEKFAAALSKEIARQQQESDARIEQLMASQQEDRDLMKQMLRAIQNGGAGSDVEDPTKAPAPGVNGSVNVEEKTYDDGTTATGTAPLPDRSPDEQKQDEQKQSGKAKHKG